MKYFEVITKVFGCSNCPYNSYQGCQLDPSCDAVFRRQLHIDNRTQLTPSCPAYKKVVKEDE